MEMSSVIFFPFVPNSCSGESYHELRAQRNTEVEDLLCTHGRASG
jgi:hypothetical protein